MHQEWSETESNGLEIDELHGKATISIEEAARLLGISRPHAYELAATGELPGLLRLGKRRLRVAVPAFLKALGVGTDPTHKES